MIDIVKHIEYQFSVAAACQNTKNTSCSDLEERKTQASCQIINEMKKRLSSSNLSCELIEMS